jgi:uncharacterized cupredoxin-like copper-binding protein
MRTLTRRQLLAAVAATLVLAAGGVVATAAASGVFTTSRSCATPHLPGTAVQVTAMDMTMMRSGPGTMRLFTQPAAVPTGVVSLLVHNVGSRTHELVVLPVTANTTAGSRAVGADGRVDETGSLGEASRGCAAGTGNGIKAGATGWVTLTLSPGRYELVCNLKNHYANGMFAELDVA